MSPDGLEDDRGLLLGDGLFETLLVEAGEPRDFQAHLDRLGRGCGVIGIPEPDPAQVQDAAREAVGASGLQGGRAALRITWTAGRGRGLPRPPLARPRLVVGASAAPPPAGPARLRTSTIRRNETSPASRLKTLSYLDNVLARRQAEAAGADEALMLNTRGEAACCAAANLFWIAEDRLFTPALDCGVLDGIVRARVLAAAAVLGLEASEARAAYHRLEAAEGMFLTSSLAGVRPVAELDGRPVAVHPLIERISSLCR